VRAEITIIQALGFTHWKAAACQKVMGRAAALASGVLGAEVAIFQASQRR
jgi:hypothetical protein